MRRILALAVAALIVGDVAAFAGPYEDGLAAVRRADYAAAAELWKPLADSGVAEAQNNLGSLYARGMGVKRDDVEAVRLYRAAADQGLAAAQSNLGYQYQTGAGVRQDLEAALMWFVRAADQGNVNAQFMLGGMYYNGEGVQKDLALAYMWLSLAAAQGDAEATRNRTLIGGSMTPAQVAEAERLVREWKPKASR